MHKNTSTNGRQHTNDAVPRADVVPMQNNTMLAFQERQMELEMRMQERYLSMQEKQQAMATVLQQGLANPTQVVQMAFSVMDDDVNAVHIIERLEFEIRE